jgi:hypothetical protein
LTKIPALSKNKTKKTKPLAILNKATTDSTEMERTLKPKQTPMPVHAEEIMAQMLARADIAKKPPLHTVDNTGETTNEKRTTAIPEW